MSVTIDETQNAVSIIDYVGDDIIVKLRYPMHGELYDLDGSSLRLYLRESKEVSSSILLDLSNGDGIAAGDFESHNIVITIDKDKTAELGQGKFYGFFTITDSLGDTDTKFSVVLRLKPR